MSVQPSLPIPEIQDQWDNGIRLVILGTPQPHPKDQARIIYPKGGKPFASMYLRMTPEQEQFRDAVQRAAKEAMSRASLPILAKHEPVRMSVTAWFVRPASNKTMYHTQRPDCSNLFYFPENVLKGIVYDDDSQVIQLEASKFWNNEESTVIIVRRWTDSWTRSDNPAVTVTAELPKW